ncbi:MAG: helix-turn-helix domain-containing protein [Lachnospiraceae bacterium]|jgi:hypothetical protein|nr:helix-turn-helix domain-containing protein [Lachnospiraceae bacterium]
MPRVSLTQEQRMKYKLFDFKIWVHGQMKANHLRQQDIADALGISQVRVSQMLKTPDKGQKDKEPDPFSLGQVIVLCELFGVAPEERNRLLTL